MKAKASIVKELDNMPARQLTTSISIKYVFHAIQVLHHLFGCLIPKLTGYLFNRTAEHTFLRDSVPGGPDSSFGNASFNERTSSGGVRCFDLKKFISYALYIRVKSQFFEAVVGVLC
jgi:hypothetical protein